MIAFRHDYQTKKMSQFFFLEPRRIHLLQKIAFPIKYVTELYTKIIYNTNISDIKNLQLSKILEE